MTSRGFALFIFTCLLCAVAPAAALAQTPPTGGTAYQEPARRRRRRRRRRRCRSRRACFRALTVPGAWPRSCRVASPPPRPTRRPRSRTRSGRPTSCRSCRTSTAAAIAVHRHGLRLLGHRLLGAALRRPARHAVRLVVLHALGRARPGPVVHGLHEPRPRLRDHRRPAARHERRRRHAPTSPRRFRRPLSAGRAGGRRCARRAATAPATRSAGNPGRKRGPSEDLARGSGPGLAAHKPARWSCSRSARRLLRRVCASRSRRRSSSLSTASCGACAGRPCSSRATIVK